FSASASSCCEPLPPHSFPTRRSSDLGAPPCRRRLHERESHYAGVHRRREDHRGQPRRVGRTRSQGHGRKFVSHLPASGAGRRVVDRKSTRLNSSHQIISYAVSCLKKQ